ELHAKIEPGSFPSGEAEGPLQGAWAGAEAPPARLYSSLTSLTSQRLGSEREESLSSGLWNRHCPLQRHGLRSFHSWFFHRPERSRPHSVLVSQAQCHSSRLLPPTHALLVLCNHWI
ncbi:zinc and ring finger 1, isoform CRA_b, partial [Mus musculus]